MSIAAVFAALEDVRDPHLPFSLRRMGMLKDVEVSDDGTVRIELSIPCLGCPGVSMLHGEIEDTLARLSDVKRVVISDGWHHRWSPDLIEPEVREVMRRNGVQL